MKKWLASVFVFMLVLAFALACFGAKKGALPPPALSANRIIVVQNPPGQQDEVSGYASAVVGSAPVTVKVYENAALTRLLGSTAANANGSFSTIKIGDNLAGTIYIVASNVAGTSQSIQKNNDIAAPTAPNASLITVAQDLPDQPKVSGASAAVEGSAMVKVYKDAGLTKSLGSTTANPEGSFSAKIGNDLVDIIYVRAEDVAGNPSTPTQVKTATLPQPQSKWEDVSSLVSDGQASFVSSLQSNGEELFIAYSDKANADKVVVKKFDGTDWISVGGAASEAEGSWISLGLDGSGTSYVAYENKLFNAAVKKFNGESWEDAGDKDFSGVSLGQNSLQIDNGLLYLAYGNNDGGKLTVQNYDASKNKWNTMWGVISVGKVEASDIALSYPYVAYNDSDAFWGGKVSVKKYDAVKKKWDVVGPLGGISAGKTFNNSLCQHNGELYLAYHNVYNGGKVAVKKYDGEKWVNIGPGGVSEGVGANVALSFPYVAYSDIANNGKIMVKKFDGANWMTWGPAAFSVGGTNGVSIKVINDVVYVAYRDEGLGGKLIVMKFSPL